MPDNSRKRVKRRPDGSVDPSQFQDFIAKGNRGDGADSPVDGPIPPPTKETLLNVHEAPFNQWSINKHHGHEWYKITDRMGNSHRSAIKRKGKSKVMPYKPHETN